MRRAVRVGPVVAIVAAALLAGGCLTSGTAGTGSSGGVGGNGGNGYGGWSEGGSGGNGHGGDGGDANGADGADGGRATVAGSGRLTSRTIDLTGVTSVVADAAFVVHLNTGEPAQAVVSMDDNLADLLDATVTGAQLHLGIKPGRSVRNATLSAEVTVGRLERLAAGGASRVVLASTVTGPALALVVSGAGSITGGIRFDRVEATASGAGSLALSGQVGELQLDASGGSRLPLAELTVRRLEATLSGASHALVTVSDNLVADASGAAVLRYRGSPQVSRSQTSGAASVVHDSP